MMLGIVKLLMDFVLVKTSIWMQRGTSAVVQTSAFCLADALCCLGRQVWLSGLFWDW
jgi:hypothetical protein